VGSAATPAWRSSVFRRPEAERARIIACVAVDGWTGEVARAFHRVGIRPVLLKGPVIARWLYPADPSRRDYVDADLLVAPDQLARAWVLLSELGFGVQEHPVLADDEHHARTFVRPRDGANIDLHRSFHGLQAVPAGRLWPVVRDHLTRIEVAGVSIDAPDRTLCALNAALHLGPSDTEESKAWQDLERAIDVVELEQWRAALGLARGLGVEHELGARLRRLAQGTALADAVGITSSGSRYYNLIGAVDRGDAPWSVLSLYRFTAQPSVHAALSYLIHKLVPPVEQLDHDYPRLAPSGSVGRAAARVLRPLHSLLRLPGAVRAFRRWS
jgi:Uncharacterised nucleotidyltransferase